MRPTIYRGIVVEDRDETLLDQILDALQTPYTSAEILSITVRSYDLTTDTLTHTQTIDPATAIVALTTSGGWEADDIGYNARLPLSGALWPEGDRSYRVEIVYQPVVGPAIEALCEFQCVGVYSS